MKPARFIRLAALGLFFSASLNGAAASRNPTALPTGEIEAPALPDVIPLRPAKAGALPEQWEQRGEEGRVVRNVVDPVLVPVLPAANNSNGTAIIVAPGGGFEQLFIDKEGLAVARRLADRGVAAFVLKYRTETTPRNRAQWNARRSDPTQSPARPEAKPQAVEDGLAALRLVRARAANWGINPQRIGFIGFSAGAMTTLAVGVTADKAARPDFIASIYGPLWERAVPRDAPPLFVALALDDPIFGTGEQLPMIQQWRDANRPIAVHLYESGGHGFSKGMQGPLWFDEFVAWMTDRGLFGIARKAALSIATSSLGELLDDPQGREILLRHFPNILSFPQLEKARTMTLKMLSTYVPQQFPVAQAEKVEADLARLRKEEQ